MQRIAVKVSGSYSHGGRQYEDQPAVESRTYRGTPDLRVACHDPLGLPTAQGAFPLAS